MLKGMERTGIKPIDDAIDEWIALDPIVTHEASLRGQLRLSDMRLDQESLEMGEEQRSESYCAEVASAFNAWLKERLKDHPLPVELRRTGTFQDHENHWAWHGYDDREAGRDWDETHSASLLVVDGTTYLIDFTASQYGYEQFPMVQRLPFAYQGQERVDWERSWNVRPMLDYSPPPDRLEASAEVATGPSLH